jgi:glycosyltransferase involved in cell wall biosynthesis
LLRAADFFLLPSTNEGLPLTILEAQATKVPVLASSTAGIPETIRDGETGFMISPDEPETYAERIELLMREPGLRQRMTDNAYAFVTREHGWRAFRERVWGLYQGLLGSGRAGSVSDRRPLAGGRTPVAHIPGSPIHE